MPLPNWLFLEQLLKDPAAVAQSTSACFREASSPDVYNWRKKEWGEQSSHFSQKEEALTWQEEVSPREILEAPRCCQLL